jgi:hypothetical protein
MIDKYEDAKKVVQDAGLIDENDGHPDIHYRKIALLLAEVKRLNALIHRDYDWLKSNYPKVFDEMMMSKLYGDEQK